MSDEDKEIKHETRCKCCFNNMGSLNMWEEYYNNDEREIYGEMLMECFALKWDTQEGEMICESCIYRLRDAVKLKIEFLAVQELLHENITLENGKELLLNTDDVEFLNEEIFEENSPGEYSQNEREQDEHMEYQIEIENSQVIDDDGPEEYITLKHQFLRNADDVEFLNEEIFEENSPGEYSQNEREQDEHIEYQIEIENSQVIDDDGPEEDNQTRDYTKKIQSNRKKKYKQYTKEDMEKAIEAVKFHGNSMLGAATRFAVPRKTLALRLLTANEERDEEKNLEEEKKIKLIEEIRMILKHTNAIPFKTKMSKRYCAYCFTYGPIFNDPDELRAHTKFNHAKNLIRHVELFMKPSFKNEILKMDVTDLECTACNIFISDWNSMFYHFAETHDLEFDEAYNRVIPYSIISDFKCVLCYENFSSFTQLDIHMNAHYCNYICYECGDPFLSSTRLKVHLKVHKTGKYSCDKCEKLFSLQQYKIKHVNLVHNQMKKTRKKSPSIQSQNQQSQCCGKCFSSNVSFDRHVKKAHGKSKKPKVKKNYVCGVCGIEFEKFVSLKYHWREHMDFLPFHKTKIIKLI